MSIGKSIAAFVVGTIFLLASTTAVIAYSFKDVLQKENLSNFIKTNLTSQLIETQCSEQCQQITQAESPIDFNSCMQLCREQASNQTQNLDSYLDSLYSQQIYGTSLGGLTSLLNTYFIPLLIATILSGIALVFLSNNPFSTLGHNLISMSISFLIIGFIPNFISLPSEAVFQTLSSYLFSPLDNMIKYGVVALVSGIALNIYGHFYVKKKVKK